MTTSKTVTHSATVALADLKKALAFARQPVERGRNTIPILGMVLLRFSAGTVEVIGTDLDIECLYRAEAETRSVFGFCAEPRYLGGIIFAGSGESVTFEVDYTTKTQTDKDGKKHKHTDAIVRVRCGDLDAAFRSFLPAEDFPIFGEDRLAGTPDRMAATINVGEGDLHRMLADTIPAISTEETRYYLNGVYLHAKDDGTMIAVATNGHRLALRKSRIPFPEPLHGIVPTKAVKIIHRALKPGGNATILMMGTSLMRRLTADQGDWQITHKLIDGTFPDYTRVVPTGVPVWSCPISLAMIRRPMAFQTGEGQSVPIKFDLKAKKLSTRLYGGDEISFPIVGCEGDVEVGFNAAYLRDVLALHSPARISSTGANDPARIETEDVDLLNVVMPMRV